MEELTRFSRCISSPVTRPRSLTVIRLDSTSTSLASGWSIISKIWFILGFSSTLAAVAAGSWEVFICTRISPMPSANSLSSPKNSKKPITHTIINRNLYLGFIRLNCAKVIQTTAYPVLPGRSYPSPPL